MDLEVVNKIIIILLSLGIFFVLPSTIYTVMFFGIFYRRRPLYLDTDDLKKTIYYPYREELAKSVAEAKRIDFEPVSILSVDGLKLFGRYYGGDSDTTLLLVHGYQSDPFNNFSTHIKFFLSQGYNVLTVDHRAHGKSKGRFTTAGYKEKGDLMKWIDWLDLNTGCSSIFIYGISMGATTVGLASDKIKCPKVKGLIMEAGFTSFYDELCYSASNVFMKNAALNYVRLCAKTFLRADIRESTTQSLSKTTIPVFFLHGIADTDVPISHTERNFLACASEKSLFLVEGAPHTLCHLLGKDAVEGRLKEFIANHLS